MRKLKYFVRGRLFPCALLFSAILGGMIYLSVKLPALLSPIAAAERVFALFVALWVFASDKVADRKLAKLFLLFLPWTGEILCLYFKNPPTVSQNETVYRGHGGLLERVGALSAHTCREPFFCAQSLEYFSCGSDMFARFFSDLKAAKKRIYLEYYIIAHGAVWSEILDTLTDKAQNGVDVRLIYDDFGCSVTLSKRYPEELAPRGIQTAVFRPLKVGRGFSVRGHKKLALIDGIAYTGGINLADEYAGNKIRFGNWKDTAVRVQGDISPLVNDFLRTWYALRPFEKRLADEKPGGSENFNCAFLSDCTGADERTFLHVFPMLALNAAQRIWLCTPYLSLPCELISALKTAARAGVDVRILIPHVPDKRAVFFLTRAYARKLEKDGVSVREYTSGFLHAKSAVLDGEYALVGSCNLDFRSLFLQEECGIFAHDRTLASALERDFENTWRQSQEVKQANKFVRTAGKLCMLFAPLT